MNGIRAPWLNLISLDVIFSEILLCVRTFSSVLLPRVGNFPTKKLFRGRWNRRRICFVPAKFRLFRETENSRSFVPNHSTEEKNARNSVPWKKSKLSESRTEPYTSEDKTTGTPFRGKKLEAFSRISVPKNLTFEVRTNQLYSYFSPRNSFPFRFELRNWLFRGPRNALPQNSVNRSRLNRGCQAVMTLAWPFSHAYEDKLDLTVNATSETAKQPGALTTLFYSQTV